MTYIDLMSPLHKATKRDYLKRVNDAEYPKEKAASLAKRWGFDYWDGDRRVNYGGYKYIAGYWLPVAQKLIQRYKLSPGSKILDIGCGKGFLLFELLTAIPGLEVRGFDISKYAIENSKVEVKTFIDQGSADKLPYLDGEFDLAISINTFHNLYSFELEAALNEFSRVSKKQYLCVESYRNEAEKANLLYWQVTCEQFNTPEEWKWWFETTKYQGDYSFIYFE